MVTENIRDKWEILQLPLNFSLISLQISHDFSWESPRIPLKILHLLSPINPPKISINPVGNLQEIPEESMQKFSSISTWIPLHRVSAILGDTQPNPRGYARWVFQTNFHLRTLESWLSVKTSMSTLDRCDIWFEKFLNVSNSVLHRKKVEVALLKKAPTYIDFLPVKVSNLWPFTIRFQVDWPISLFVAKYTMTYMYDT